MKEWNDLINGLTQISSKLHQSVTNTALNTLQTFAKSTRTMSSGLKDNVPDQIINQIDAHADYLYWVASQATTDTQLNSYLFSTLSQLISLLSRVVGSTQYIERPEGTAWTPYPFFTWRPWGGWWCGPSIYYLLRLINRMQAWLLRRSISNGAIDEVTTTYLEYTASQTQFILNGTPKEYESLLGGDLTANIKKQSQEIVSMVDGIVKDMKLPEWMTAENLGDFDQIKSSFDQMTDQMNPALINSFSELSKAAQTLISETKKQGEIMAGVTYQLKSLVSEGESMYSCISDTVSGTIGESLNSIRENLQSVSTTVDSFFAQIGEESLASIPIQQLDALDPPLTQLSSTSSAALGQMNLSSARRDELDAIIITDAMLFYPWIYPVPYRYYGVSVYVNIPTGAIARSPVTRAVTRDVTRGLGRAGTDLGKGLDKVGTDLGKGLDKVGKDISTGLGGIGKGMGGIGKSMGGIGKGLGGIGKGMGGIGKSLGGLGKKGGLGGLMKNASKLGRKGGGLAKLTKGLGKGGGLGGLTKGLGGLGKLGKKKWF